MKKYLTIITFIASGAAIAGGTSTGTPPALEELMQVMAYSPELNAGLFDAGDGDIGLLAQAELQPQMLVSGGSQGGGTPPASDGTPSLTVSANDIAILYNRTKPINAVGITGQNLSFKISPGDTLDSVTLQDRRELVRAASRD